MTDLDSKPEVKAPRKAAASAQPFVFGSEIIQATGSLQAIDRMSERLARKLRDSIEVLARAKPKITAVPVSINRFGSWRQAQAEFTSLSLYRMKPLKGGLLIALEPGLISRLVDIFYGGSGAPAAARSSEFTPTEQRLLARLTDGLVDGLTEIWSEILPVQIQLSARETNIAYANLVRSDEPVVLAEFKVSVGAHAAPASIQILYPLASLRAVEMNLSAKVQDDGPSACGVWREQLEDALGEVRVQARSVLARPTLSTLELLRLAPGDVIPISLPSLVPLLISGKTIALGTIGEHDGRAALKIEKIAQKGKNAQ